MDEINKEYSEKLKEFKHIPYEYTQITTELSLLRTQEFYEIMNKRRSIRFFSDKNVSEELIKNIVRTAGTAPSGAHKQPWTFTVVKDKDTKKKIRIAAEEEEKTSYQGRMSQEWLDNLAPLGTTWEKPFLERAPYLIVVFKQQYGIDKEGIVLRY